MIVANAGMPTCPICHQLVDSRQACGQFGCPSRTDDELARLRAEKAELEEQLKTVLEREAAITAYLAALPRTDLVERLETLLVPLAIEARNAWVDGSVSVALAREDAIQTIRQAAAVISATGGKTPREVHNSALEEAAQLVLAETTIPALHKFMRSNTLIKASDGEDVFIGKADMEQAIRDKAAAIRALKLPENGGES